MAVKQSLEITEIDFKKFQNEFKDFEKKINDQAIVNQNFMDNTKFTLKGHHKRLEDNKEEIIDEAHVRQVAMKDIQKKLFEQVALCTKNVQFEELVEGQKRFAKIEEMEKLKTDVYPLLD